MKQIYVLRHSEWDKDSQKITQSGLALIDRVKTQLPKFSIIRSSPVERTVQTARLIDGESALIVSHDAIILGARKILQGQPFEVTPEKYGELCGFIINENL